MKWQDYKCLIVSREAFPWASQKLFSEVTCLYKVQTSDTVFMLNWLHLPFSIFAEASSQPCCSLICEALMPPCKVAGNNGRDESFKSQETPATWECVTNGLRKKTGREDPNAETHRQTAGGCNGEGLIRQMKTRLTVSQQWSINIALSRSFYPKQLTNKGHIQTGVT